MSIRTKCMVPSSSNLAYLIEKKSWQEAMDLCESKPELARSIQKISLSRIGMSPTVLHRAVVYGGPLRLIQKILQVAPGLVSVSNGIEQVPLSLACSLSSVSRETFYEILNATPWETIIAKNPTGTILYHAQKSYMVDAILERIPKQFHYICFDDARNTLEAWMHASNFSLRLDRKHISGRAHDNSLSKIHRTVVKLLDVAVGYFTDSALDGNVKELNQLHKAILYYMRYQGAGCHAVEYCTLSLTGYYQHLCEGQNEHGNTPLHFVLILIAKLSRCKYDHWDIVGSLIHSYPRACKMRNKKGEFPLHLFAQCPFGPRYMGAKIFAANPTAILTMDMPTELFPYVLAKINKSFSRDSEILLRNLYEILLAKPDILKDDATSRRHRRRRRL